ADHCRSRILKLLAAFWRSRRESDAIAERLRALPSDPAFVDLEGATEQRPERSRRSDEAGRAPPEKSRRTIGDGAALAVALVDCRIRIDRHAGESENLRRGLALIDRRIGFLSRGCGEEDPLLHRRNESAVRYHHEAAAAFCLPRFSTSTRRARGIREQDGVSDRRAGRN